MFNVDKIGVVIVFRYEGGYSTAKNVCAELTTDDESIYAWFDEDINTLTVESKVHQYNQLVDLHNMVHDAIDKVESWNNNA